MNAVNTICMKFCNHGTTNLFVSSFCRANREKYFMLGEPNERKDIDEETALEPDARFPNCLSCNFCGYFAFMAIHSLVALSEF